MSDEYDVLPLPTHIGSIIDKNNSIIKPFVGVYFPVELLTRMGWSKDTILTLSIEKNSLKIREDKERDPYIYDLGELTYELSEES